LEQKTVTGKKEQMHRVRRVIGVEGNGLAI
jgi:hypothetical protein